MRFEDYVRRGKVKKKTPDPIEADGLFAKALSHLSYAEKNALDPSSASFIFADAYASAREAAQSLMSRRGFKPYSHEATIVFIKEFYGFEEELISEFHRFRQLRNDAEYLAAEISVEQAKECLAFARRIISRIQDLD